MVPTSKISAIVIGSEIAVIITTANQSIKKQPCLWLAHGSGGISSNDDIWRDKALAHGYTVIQVDSYSNRGIFKQHWDSLEEYRIVPEVRAHDLVLAMDHLQRNQQIIPFADLNESICVGFSDGATAAICVQENHVPAYWKSSFCMYPGLAKHFVNRLEEVRGDRIHLFVGAEDNWTPAVDCQILRDKINCSLTIYEDTHHSFSKPGINQWHENTLRTRTERGVFCKYNAESTRKVMEQVFGE